MARFWRSLAVTLIGAVLGSAAEYFPAGVLGETSDQHQFRAAWYSKHLSAMGEPSLLEVSRQDATAEVYRFLYLRSFNHPISVRLVVRKDGTALLISKETDGKGGYAPGKLIRNTTGPLPKEQTEWLRDRVDGAAFWKLPTRGPDKFEVDGAQWIVEMARNGRYHVVDRWSPRPTDPVHGLGIALLINLAHFKLLYEDVY